MTSSKRAWAPLFCTVAGSIALLAADTPPSGTPAVPEGFTIEAIARIADARELAAAPNGDLFVGTLGHDVELVPDAEGSPGEPHVYAHLPDGEAAGVALADGRLFVGTTFGVWTLPYAPGEREARAAPHKLFDVRTGGGGGHSTTSVAVSGETLFASVGSSCNACEEHDPTRATILEADPDGGAARPRATHIRNAIALAVDPATHDLWAGVAGQDELEHGHPYEIFDDVSVRPGTPEYGWPTCYEDRRPARTGADCATETVPAAVFPAYETPIGAAFYPRAERGRFTFPEAWRGGAFVALHGSWHQPPVPPRVVFVPVTGSAPRTPVDWNDPGTQWKPFVTGYQEPDGRRIGRPTGVAVGADGSLFVADDASGMIYRIRPR